MLHAIPAALHSVPTSVWAAIAVVMLPIVVIFGSLLVKLLWGLWALPIGIAVSGYAVWRLGIEWFWLVAVGIIVGLLGTWLWQRSRLFLAGDRLLERIMFLGD